MTSINYETSEFFGCVCATDIKAENVVWAVCGFFALGALSIIAGQPGLGKSQLAILIAAALSMGGPLPGTCIETRKGRVLILGTEDDLAYTLIPRLIAAGADLSLIEFPTSIYTLDKKGKKKSRAPTFKRDIDNFDALLSSRGDVVVMIFDPLSVFYGDNIDSHNAADIRGALTPLIELAAKHKVALIGIAHLNKSNATGAMNRINGSTALIAAARAGYMVVCDPDNKNRRLFLPVKNNLARDTDGLAFTIESVVLDGDIETSRVVLEPDSVRIDADDVLATVTSAEDRSALDEAKVFLQTLLHNGPVFSKQVMQEARQAGHSEATIKRAKASLNIRAHKRKGDGLYEWCLPVHMDHDTPPFQGEQDE